MPLNPQKMPVSKPLEYMIMLKKISSQALMDIEQFLGAKVFMECWVKVKEDWRDSNYILNDFGFKDE